MHAYAFVDPVFFVLNDIGQQRSANRLDQFCVSCHSPFASLLQETPPGFDQANLSPLARQGVQCDVCHMMKTSARGRGISAFHLDGARRGPITDPQPNAFHESIFDRSFLLSGVCSGCHDVVNPTGLLVETTSTEWDNSEYAIMSIECQDCHMPAYSGQAAVGGPVREVHRHTFTGVDVPLVDFPGREQTIEAVRDLLQNAITMSVEAPAQVQAGDTVVIRVTLRNDFTGHNIPSGTIFERQMWIEITATDAQSGQIVYRSGHLDGNGDLLNHHSEAVRSGALSRDRDLALFHGIPYRNGQETLFFWEADSIANKAIPPFQTRTATYRIGSDQLTATTIHVSVRVRFRAFPPYFLREIGLAHLIEHLPIFDMTETAASISIVR